jgi:hypothetical protein
MGHNYQPPRKFVKLQLFKFTLPRKFCEKPHAGIIRYRDKSQRCFINVSRSARADDGGAKRFQALVCVFKKYPFSTSELEIEPNEVVV